jgi:ferritin-like metal-binding protein YciE
MAILSKDKNAQIVKSQYALMLDLIVSQLCEVYCAEKHITTTVSQLFEKSAAKTLRSTLTDYISKNAICIGLLDQAFILLDRPSQHCKCYAAKGITLEGERIISTTAAGTTQRDVAIISTLQILAQFLMTYYECIIRSAKLIELYNLEDVVASALVGKISFYEKLEYVANNKLPYSDATN